MDLEIGGRRTMGCSALSLALIVVAAAFTLLSLPALSAASYTNADIGVNWALIKATTKKPDLPSQVTIGMFRICYSTPGVSCLAFQWGLTIDKVSFQGAEKWAAILPPLALTRAWALLSAGAFALTFLGAFAYCNCAPMQFIVAMACLCAAVDITYLAITGTLFYMLYTRINNQTDYQANYVLANLAVFIASCALLVIVPPLTMFLGRNDGDTLILPNQNGPNKAMFNMLGHYMSRQDKLMNMLAVANSAASGAEKAEATLVAKVLGIKKRDRPENPYKDANMSMKAAQMKAKRDEFEKLEEADNEISEEAVELQLKYIREMLPLPVKSQRVADAITRLQQRVGVDPSATQPAALATLVIQQMQAAKAGQKGCDPRAQVHGNLFGARPAAEKANAPFTDRPVLPSRSKTAPLPSKAGPKNDGIVAPDPTQELLGGPAPKPAAREQTRAKMLVQQAAKQMGQQKSMKRAEDVPLPPSPEVLPPPAFPMPEVPRAPARAASPPAATTTPAAKAKVAQAIAAMNEGRNKPKASDTLPPAPESPRRPPPARSNTTPLAQPGLASDRARKAESVDLKWV